jgi:Calcium/calmodulin dependent protein kinase II association domain
MIMKITVSLLTITLALSSLLYSQAYSAAADSDKRGDKVKEEIWALEETYFANLYKADYEGVLALVHSQFLGWPGNVAQPIDRAGSSRFMKQLITKPTSCVFAIERGGIRVLGEVALTQYTISVNCGDIAAGAKTQTSRITHTWVREGGRWKLLGGMSYDR